LNAPRKIWKVSPSDVQISGYVRTVKNFVQVIVLRAGHMVSAAAAAAAAVSQCVVCGAENNGVWPHLR
jgi:hypothetical protein